MRFESLLSTFLLTVMPLLVVNNVFAACPQPEQPALSQTLEPLIAGGHAASAMSCIAQLHRQQQEEGSVYPDEVRYQLAKLYSDAIYRLSKGALGAARESDHSMATELWRRYVDEVHAPYDSTRALTGFDRILQHGRYGKLDDALPSIARAASIGRKALAPQQANNLFSLVKRCPLWRQTVDPPPNALCSQPCAAVGSSLVASLRRELGSDKWDGAPGLSRLAENLKAFEGALQCGMP